MAVFVQRRDFDGGAGAHHAPGMKTAREDVSCGEAYEEAFKMMCGGVDEEVFGDPHGDLYDEGDVPRFDDIEGGDGGKKHPEIIGCEAVDSLHRLMGKGDSKGRLMDTASLCQELGGHVDEETLRLMSMEDLVFAGGTRGRGTSHHKCLGGSHW